MSFRAFRAAAAAAFLLAAFPAAAQHFSDGYKFIEAIRKGEGNDVIQILKDTNGSIINAKDRSTGEGALHIVARRGDATYLRFLLQKGANPNILDTEGNTPMMAATTAGFVEGVQILLKYKGNVNQPNQRGETPLIRAVQLRNREMVEALLGSGADPDRADFIAGMSARDYAKADTRSPDIGKLLAAAPKADRSAVAGPRL